jgi:hypothetical protein
MLLWKITLALLGWHAERRCLHHSAIAGPAYVLLVAITHCVSSNDY